MNKAILLTRKLALKFSHLREILIPKVYFGKCGRNVSLSMPSVVMQPEKMFVGDDVAIGFFVHIWAGGGVTIGNRVMIASHCALTTLTHDYMAEDMTSTIIAKPICIEDDVWIGAHSVILPGVTIGSHSVVGAGSVVTKNVECGSIVAGVPAHIIRRITDFQKVNITSKED